MNTGVSKKLITFFAVVLFTVIALGLFWLFTFKGTVGSGVENDLGIFWWIFSFAAGLSMIVLPCTLPLAFVIVPLSMGRGIVKGLGMALSFGIGIALTLSLYGVVAALAGKAAIGALGSDAAETIKNWVYFIAGIFALLFALSEIGLMKFRMPTYTGAAPAFIQKKQDYLKAFLLGLFLGNIGVGCPHPATPLILVEIASSGNVLYGWLLFLVHAIGRILPLIFLAILGIMGVNGLSWLVARKDKVEKITGWAMVFVAGFILTLGLFSHDWWVNSGIHTQLEKITQEESILNVVKENIGSEVTHQHGAETGTGLFSLPLALGNWFLVFVWVFPLWWWWIRDKKRVDAIPEQNQVKEKDAEHRLLMSREKFFTTLTIVLALVFIYILPHNFLKHEALEHGQMGTTEETEHAHAPGTPAEHTHDDTATDDHMSVQAGSVSDRTGGAMMDMDGEHMMPATGGLHEENGITEGLAVNNISPKTIRVGEQTTLTFFVNEKPSGIPVDDLEIEHEKYYHLIGMREDLTQFFHLHPEKAGAGIWKVTYTFTEPGQYKLWSDVKREGVGHTFAHTLFTVSDKTGNVPMALKQPVDYLTNVMVGNYQVELHYNSPLIKGLNETLHFTVKNLFGNGVQLKPYLGADMHLVIIKDDLSEYVHAHPGESGAGTEKSSDGHDHSHGSNTGGASPFAALLPAASAHVDEEPHVEPTTLPFSVVFPSEGTYKLFAQFIPTDALLGPDEVLLAEFYVKVAKDGVKSVKAASTVDPIVKWWSLLIISILLMSLLSYGVFRYLQVK